ncbi:MAG: hypothetical protein RL322_2212 [Pseudomonadota bacterium]|jgi:hypothetical protein
MLGLSLSALSGADTDLSDSPRLIDPAAGKTAKGLMAITLGSGAEGRPAAGFAQRLEDALEAVRDQADPAVAGNLLPAVPLTAHPLGASSELILPADGEKTPEDVLYALALAQGLEPGVVQAVLWPQGGASPSVTGTEAGPSVLEARLELLESGVAAQPDAAMGVLPAGVPLSLPAGGFTGHVLGSSTMVQGDLASLGGSVSPAVVNTLQSVSSPAAAQHLPFQAGSAEAGVQNAPAGARVGVGHEPSVLPSPAVPGGQKGGGPDGAGSDPSIGAGRSETIKPARDWLGANLSAEVATPGPSVAPRDAPGGARLARLISESLDDSAAGDSNRARVMVLRPDAVTSTMTALPAAQWALRQARVDFNALTVGARSSGAVVSDELKRPAMDSVNAPEAAGSDPILPQSPQRMDVLDLGESGLELDTVNRTPSAREALQEKVSEALAQRMVAHINRGNWSLQLELKPADLGSISIDMNFQNGRLEALFDASAAPARALLGDSLDRLRQELERSGMNVAYLGMQNTSGGSSGGKPTPGRSDRKADGVASVAAAPEEGAEVAEQRARSRGGAGLDLMV